MPSDPLDDYIAATARVLELPIDPAWQPSVRANLELTLRLAAVVAEFPLPDEADAAAVFEA
jgi:1-carboxybiuret hydrolase subunit AtzG-like protein